MSELIVNKLRRIAGDGSCCNAHAEQVCLDAADEIERLKAVLASMKESLNVE